MKKSFLNYYKLCAVFLFLFVMAVVSAENNDFLTGYEEKLENSTDIGAMAFNNRLMIDELKQCLKVCFLNNKFVDDCIRLPECSGVLS